ncbi:MAG: PAS domain-containing protein, partial [Desulfobulbales bacterium]
MRNTKIEKKNCSQTIKKGAADVSHRTQADSDGRHHKEALLRAIIDATDVMLVYLDSDFNFLWVNPAYAKSCSMKPEEMAGKNHFALYPNKENEEIFSRVRDTGEPVFFKDKPFEFPDQPERGLTYWDWSLVPVMSTDDRVTGLVFTLRETTRYKKAELDLVRSEERFRLMAETSADIIFQMEPSGVITYVSPAIHEFGYIPEQAIGRHFTEYVQAEDLARAEDAMKEIYREKKIMLMELRLKKSGGEAVECEISAKAIKRDGAVVGVQGIARDISGRKRAEEKINLRTGLLKGIKSIFEVGMRCESEEELAAATLHIAENLTGSRFGFIGEIGQDDLLHGIAISDP